MNAILTLAASNLWSMCTEMSHGCEAPITKMQFGSPTLQTVTTQSWNHNGANFVKLHTRHAAEGGGREQAPLLPLSWGSKSILLKCNDLFSNSYYHTTEII